MTIDRSYFVSSAIGDAEFVFGVIAPLGTQVEEVEKTIRDRMRHFEYTLECIRFSTLIETFEGLKTELKQTPEAARISTYMDAGNELRKNRSDILSLAAIRQIRQLRFDRRGKAEEPGKRVAYFLHTLKHPEEVRTLREVYGRGFFLLGVSSSAQARLDYLHQDKRIPEGEAHELLQRDESDEEGHGQQTRDAFQMADAFITLGADRDADKRELWRILDLLFGQTFFTPTVEEHAMFLAYATSLRSADLSRQVGAIILSRDGDVLATGANDVPQAGGGQYWTEGFTDWPEKKPLRDKRDWFRGKDSNKERREEIIQDFASRVAKIAQDDVSKAIREILVNEEHLRAPLLDKLKNWLPSPKALEQELQGSPIMDLTEFGRAVHAEMEALLCCARIGVSTRKSRLFTTTFPCHNCTKHIIAADVAEVFYIEPYPKSLAERLHGDEISVAKSGDPVPPDHHERRVIFRSFSGVGPRRFFDLFSLQLGMGRAVSRKADVGKWNRGTETQLRVSVVPTSYLERESGAVLALDEALVKRALGERSNL